MYQTGVGTRWWWIGKLLWGLFGLGALSRVDRALARLEENRGRGDAEVDIVVDVCYHGLALDEGLATLPLTRPSASPANDDADAPWRLFEVWFRGAHSDIGGGNGNTGLSTITLT